MMLLLLYLVITQSYGVCDARWLYLFEDHDIAEWVVVDVCMCVLLRVILMDVC